MGFLTRNFKKVQEEPKPKETEYHGYFVEKQDDEIYVGEREALEIPSFVDAEDMIVNAISRLDVTLCQEDENGKIKRHIKDYRLKLLNEENSYYSNAIDYKKQVLRDILRQGISYSYLDKKGLDIKGLYRIDPRGTVFEQDFNDIGIPKSIKADITLNNIRNTVDLEDLLVIPFRSEDGITGKSIFEKNQKILKIMYQELEYSESVYKNSSIPFGVLETQSKVAKDVVERLKATWSNLYKGSKNSGKIAVLENGLTYKPISQNPQDIMLIDSRKANIREMEKIFNLPPGMLDENTEDVESKLGYFINKTIEPIVKLLEESFNKALLLEDEKEEGYYFKINTEPLRFTKSLDEINVVRGKLESGIFTANEGRQHYDMDEFEGEEANSLLLSLGNILLTPNGIKVPNMDGGDKNKDKWMKNNNNIEEGKEGTTIN